MTKIGTALTMAVFLAGLVGTGVVLAQTRPPDCRAYAAAPQVIEGRVENVDPQRGTVTLRASDGTRHELQAGKETTSDVKVGDRISARKRSTPNC
jgi:hypothetical protein